MSEILTTIQGQPIHYRPPCSNEGDFEKVWFLGNMDVDCDGPNGNPDHDPYWQPTTTLKYQGQYIDSYKVPGIVVPPIVRQKTIGVVMGCLAFATLQSTARKVKCIVYDIGPKDKIGEGSVELCKRMGIPHNPNTGGIDDLRGVLFEIFPGRPVTIDGITYDLQPA